MARSRPPPRPPGAGTGWQYGYRTTTTSRPPAEAAAVDALVQDIRLSSMRPPHLASSTAAATVLATSIAPGVVVQAQVTTGDAPGPITSFLSPPIFSGRSRAAVVTAVKATAVNTAAGGPAVPALAPIGEKSIGLGPLSPVVVPQTASFLPVPATDAATSSTAAATDAVPQEEERGGWGPVYWKHLSVPADRYQTPSPRDPPKSSGALSQKKVADIVMTEIESGSLSLEQLLDSTLSQQAEKAADDAANYAQVLEGLQQRQAEREEERSTVKAEAALKQAQALARQEMCRQAAEKARALEAAVAELKNLERRVAHARKTVAQRMEEAKQLQQTDAGRIAYEEQGIAAQAEAEVRREQALQHEQARSLRPPPSVCSAIASTPEPTKAKKASARPRICSEAAAALGDSSERESSDSESNDGSGDMILEAAAAAVAPSRSGAPNRGAGGRGPGKGWRRGIAKRGADAAASLRMTAPHPQRRKQRASPSDQDAKLPAWVKEVLALGGYRGSQIATKSGWTIAQDKECARLGITRREDLIAHLKSIPPLDPKKDNLSLRTLQQYADGLENMLSFSNDRYHDLASLNAWFQTLEVENPERNSKKQTAVDFAIAHYHPGLKGFLLPTGGTEYKHFKNWGTGLELLPTLLA